MGCNVQTVRLHTDTAGYIGDIKDICRMDSFLHILDGATLSVSKFNQDGLLLRQISTQGNGPMEYIQPMALCADKSHVYLLDLPVFNWEGEKVQTLTLDIPCTNICISSDSQVLWAIANNPDPELVKFILPTIEK